RGARVLLVDRARFPRAKVCGGCLGPRGLAVLRDEGLPAPPAPATPLAAVRLLCAGRALELPLPPMVAVSREDLDAALVAAAAEAGAQLLLGTRAEALSEPDGPSRTLLLHGEAGATPVVARVVVAADGLAGRLLGGAALRATPRSRVGAGVLLPEAPAALPAGRLLMAAGRAGYVGLVRLPDGRLDVAAALDPRAVARAGGAGRLMADVLAQAGGPRLPELDEAEVRLTPPLTRRTARPAGHRLLAVGDAAGFVEPFTGEGLSWALLSGRAVVPLALDGARRWDERLAHAWVRSHRVEVARHQRLCRVLAAWLRHPLLVRAGLALVARRPALAHGLLARLGAPPAIAP
ncbi:MAG TPA: FAD-dependent monooxygenase, partial [Planctomycetota bacterium]|nr:FAD-dependent monooxygenase [Planctomycetota bacterium]